MPLEGISTSADAFSGLSILKVSLQVAFLEDVEFWDKALDVQNASGIVGKRRMLRKSVEQFALVADCTVCKADAYYTWSPYMSRQ